MQQILERVYTDNELLEMPHNEYRNICNDIHDKISSFLNYAHTCNVESVSLESFEKVVVQLTTINLIELSKHTDTLKLLIDQASNDSGLQQTFPYSAKPKMKKMVKVRVKRAKN